MSPAVAAGSKHTSDFEILFVNDGSPDQALDLHRKDARVCVIDWAWGVRPYA